MSDYSVWWVCRTQTVSCIKTKDLKALQCNNARGHLLSFWVESLNQRVTGGDNCVWAINTIREFKSFLTRPSSPNPASTRSQTDSRHLTAPTKPQGTYFSQTVRQRGTKWRWSGTGDAKRSSEPAASHQAVISGFPLAPTVKTWQRGTDSDTEPLIPCGLRNLQALDCNCENSNA